MQRICPRQRGRPLFFPHSKAHKREDLAVYLDAVVFKGFQDRRLSVFRPLQMVGSQHSSCIGKVPNPPCSCPISRPCSRHVRHKVCALSLDFMTPSIAYRRLTPKAAPNPIFTVVLLLSVDVWLLREELCSKKVLNSCLTRTIIVG